MQKRAQMVMPLYKKNEVRRLILKPVSHFLDWESLHPSWLCWPLSAAIISLRGYNKGWLSWRSLVDIHGIEMSPFLKNICFSFPWLQVKKIAAM